jgi:hypothetical protein
VLASIVHIVSAENVLCGDCEPHLTAWGTQCVDCSNSNSALNMLLLLAASSAYVFFIFLTSQSSSPLTKIVMYFAQTSLIILGPFKLVALVSFFGFDLGVRLECCVRD